MKTFFVEKTSSTMDLSRELIAGHEMSSPFVVMCRTQTSGRGRGGSVWSQADGPLSSADTNEVIERADFVSGIRLCESFGPCTFVIPGHLLKIPLSWVSLAAGCAVVDALWRARSRIANRLEFSELFATEEPFEAKLKWPNDVWAWPSLRESSTSARSPKKVAGILCESSFRADNLQFVTIGLGLNLLAAPEHIPHAGCVVEMWGIKRSGLTGKMQSALNEIVAEEIEREISDYLLTERSAEQIRHLATERSLPIGTLLSVNKGEQTGGFLGLSQEGGLLLEGHDAPIHAAEVSFPAPFARVCLDFGNSKIHWRTESGSIEQTGQIDWSKINRKAILEQDLFFRTEFAQQILSSVGSATRVELVWCGVANASQTSKIIHALESLLVTQGISGREVLLTPLGADLILRAAELSADYVTGQIGVDRALQAWSAAKMARDHQKTVAVFSIGTAFTGLVVAPQPKLLESFILPGPAMALQALHEKTARLPDVALPKSFLNSDDPSPFSTSLTMLRGVLLQLRGVVETVVHQFAVDQIILTGGGAVAGLETFPPVIQSLTQVEPQLVLKAMSAFVSDQKNIRLNALQIAEDGDEGLPESVLQSMLRARISRRRSQRVVLDRKHFRRLGGRLEHAGVGLRLDRHLGEKFKFHTRDLWQQRVEIGEILIEQNSPKNHLTDEAPAHLLTVKPTYTLRQGDQIWLFHPPEYEPDMMTNIEVVYDDGDAAVFCKPGNLVVHAAGLYGKNTFIEIAKKMGFANAAPVHRIDRETSGILVCARSTPLRRELSLSFRDSSVKKMYLAVTKGERSVPETFRVELPIGPAVNSRIRLKLWYNPQEGLSALTHCVRLARWEDYSLFACLPQTGRTNQIRVHLAAIGHWIVGDKMYHPDEDAFLKFYEEGYVPEVAQKVLMPRHWLHNTGIQFFSRPESALGRDPVIAPLTEDLMMHAPTLELLRRASLPAKPDEQKKAFAELFQRLLTIDFSQMPALGPVGD